MEVKNYEHPLSWKALGRVVLVVGLIFLSWKLLDVILLVVIALMLSAALYPLVLLIHKRLPLVLSAALVMIVVFLPLIIVFSAIISTFFGQLPALTNYLDNTIDQSVLIPEQFRHVDLTQYSQNIGTYFLRSTSIIANFVTSFLTIIFLCLYILVDAKNLHQLLLKTLPKKNTEAVENLIKKVAAINGSYIRGNLLISVVCSTLIAIGLTVLGVPYAILLAIFAGIFDLLPNVGAFIGAVPAVILGFSISPLTGVLVIILYLAYQQFENNVIAPNVYNRVLDLSPTISFLSVIIGSALFGAIGAFIALPIAASVPTIIKFIESRRVLAE